jgi:hypothetical protein
MKVATSANATYMLQKMAFGILGGPRKMGSGKGGKGGIGGNGGVMGQRCAFRWTRWL